MPEQTTTDLAAAVPGASRRTTKWIRWLLVAASLAVIVLGFCGLDAWFYVHVSCRLNTENAVDRDFYTITKPVWLAFRLALASVYGAAGLAAVFLVLDPQAWRTVVRALVAALVAALLANILQGAIGRLRPNQSSGPLAFAPPLSKLLSKDDVGFPSGEAAMAFALASAFSRCRPRWGRALYPLAALGAVSRLANGAHYVSDVVAGALFGGLCARWLLWFLYRCWPERAPRHQPDAGQHSDASRERA